jgi:cohesin loading factor subunit SCC2
LIAAAFILKDLAAKSIEELWFPESADQMGKHSVDDHGPQFKQGMIDKVSVIMGVSENFRDRPQALEELLHQVSLTHCSLHEPLA